MRLTLMTLSMLLLLFSAGIASDWHIEHLDNGLKVMILEYHQVPQVNISTTIAVGAKNETDFFDGATHLLEHLILFRGTEKMTGEEVAEAMTKHGAYFNGYTSANWTDFVISLPKENLDFGLQIHADMLFRSNFPTDEMDKERQVVLEEISRTEDNPVRKIYRASLQSLYGDHPYSKNVLGSRERVSNVPRDSVYAYYKRFYAPNNMTMVIVGDVSAPETMTLVKEYFGQFPKGAVPHDNYNSPPVYNDVIELEIKKDINQAYLMMSMIGPKVDDPDLHAIDIMADILGNGESSRLQKKLKDELGLVYSANFSFYTMKYEGPMFAFATLDQANIAKVEKAVKEVLADASADGFTEKELRKAKNSIKTGFFTSMERGLDIADYYSEFDSFMGHEFVDTYPEKIENVTLAELNAAAKKFLNTESYIKTTVMPK